MQLPELPLLHVHVGHPEIVQEPGPLQFITQFPPLQFKVAEPAPVDVTVQPP